MRDEERSQGSIISSMRETGALKLERRRRARGFLCPACIPSLDQTPSPLRRGHFAVAGALGGIHSLQSSDFSACSSSAEPNPCRKNALRNNG